jgi:D-glycero-alpha-D-manno-heptose 1-phosphate guanylyltransferase
VAHAVKGIAVILVGGLGTRVRHLLQGRPKPLAPVAGRPFLEWVIRFLHREGITRIVLAAGYAAGQVDEFASKLALPGLELRVVTESEPRGTAGALAHCRAALADGDAPVLVANGDSLALTPLAPLYGAFGVPGTSAAMMALHVDDSSRYGSVAVASDGRLLGFAEKRGGGEPGLINAGVYLLGRDVVASLPGERPLSFETDVFPSLVAQGARVQVVPARCAFLDIGTEASLAAADGFIKDNLHWFGV